MVHLRTLSEMKDDYRDNKDTYAVEHPGEIILYENSIDSKMFFKTLKDYEEYIAQFDGIIGRTRYHERLPGNEEEVAKENMQRELEKLYEERELIKKEIDDLEEALFSG